MVQQTSVAAFQDNTERFASMGDRILDYMRGHGEARTRHEIADHLGITTATMSGRIHHLLKKGRLIEEPGKFQCRITKNMVRGVSAA